MKRYALNGSDGNFYWVYVDLGVLFVFYVIFCIVTFISLHKITWTSTPSAQRETEKEMEKKKENQKLLHQLPSYGVLNDSTESQKLLQKTVGSHLAFKNLSYTVPLNKNPITRITRRIKTKQLLHSINGYVEPGQMVALMGASGAGKSTLLDVLAGRKTGGKIEGNILLNGKEKDEFFARLSGYVEQFNVFIPTLTVYETVRFSANMRMTSSVSKDEIESRITESMRMVGIYDIRNQVVGTLESGLSPEKRFVTFYFSINLDL